VSPPKFDGRVTFSNPRSVGGRPPCESRWPRPREFPVGRPNGLWRGTGKPGRLSPSPTAGATLGVAPLKARGL
jgi:hypothetical protein